MNKKLEEWLRKFKQTHYGNDTLGTIIIVIAIILDFIFLIFPALFFLQTISLALIIYELTRFFSKNIERRQKENLWFSNIKINIQNYINDQRYYIKNSKTHKFFVCPNCKKICKVPKHKGKIKIKCPNCGTTFIKKT